MRSYMYMCTFLAVRDNPSSVDPSDVIISSSHRSLPGNANRASLHGPSHHRAIASDGDALSSDATYPSHLQPAYQAPAHLISRTVHGRSQQTGRSYQDFIRDLQAKSPPRSFDAARPRSQHAPMRAGYESDVGYRSDGYYQRASSGATHAQWRTSSGGRVRTSGYSSDWDPRVAGRAAKRSNGYTSDFEVHSQRKQLAVFDENFIQPLNQSPAQSRHVTSNQQPRSAAGAHASQLRSDQLYTLQSSPHARSAKVTSSASGRGEEREAASSDDDRYRAQLYEASVRLQKSPNDSARRRKQLSHEVSALLARCSADLACSYTLPMFTVHVLLLDGRFRKITLS